jgi:hypothetical protein
VAACNNSSKVNGDIVVLNGMEALKNPKELKLSDIAESIEYVKLETSPECLVSEGSFVVEKQYIVCFNRKPGNVLLFTRGGKFIRSGPIPYMSEGGIKYFGSQHFIYLQNRYFKDSLNFPRVIVLDQNMANPKTLYKIDNKPNPDRIAAYPLRSLMEDCFGRIPSYPRKEWGHSGYVHLEYHYTSMLDFAYMFLEYVRFGPGRKEFCNKR